MCNTVTTSTDLLDEEAAEIIHNDLYSVDSVCIAFTCGIMTVFGTFWVLMKGFFILFRHREFVVVPNVTTSVCPSPLFDVSLF